MKNYFIVNPAAGPTNCGEYLYQLLSEQALGFDWELYESKCPVDAAEFVRKCAAESTEPMRFFACGGDGTLNSVMTGAVGFPHVSVGVYPCGSGNDYVKHFGGAKPFLDIPALLAGTDYPVDLMKVDHRFAVNVLNFGADAEAAHTMHQVKRKKIIGGDNAYRTGALVSMITSMRTRCTVVADGETLAKKVILLCSLACGSFYGGEFFCAPRSVCNDGLMELCLAAPMSRFRALTALEALKQGRQFEEPRLADHIIYRRCKNIHVTAPEKFSLCLDGEITHVKEFTAEVLHKAIRFILPAGAGEITPAR